MFHELKISIKLALGNLRANAGRTALTLVGVVIGITSVMVISSSGEGVKSFVLGQVETFGSDIIQVEVRVPSTTTSSSGEGIPDQGNLTGVQITTLTIDDAEEALKLPNVAGVYAGSIAQELISYREENKRVVLFGAGASAPEVDANLKVSEGEFYSREDDEDQARVAVIGADIKEDFFGQEDALGKNIKIKGENYRVVGVLDKRGAVTFFNFDEIIYVPIQTLQKKISGFKHVQFFSVKVIDQNATEVTVEDLRDMMRRRHDIDDPKKDDFIVTSIKEAREIIGDVFATINILLLALTSISLVVGGVGIMNVMYVAVAERTFEIGLRKAVGASPSAILKQFLWEAIFITFAGGFVGIALGFVLSYALSYLFTLLGYDLEFLITLRSIMIAAGFSIATGIVFGYYPARKASRLSPMEAIRKE